jgi:hypothetical protein
VTPRPLLQIPYVWTQELAERVGRLGARRGFTTRVLAMDAYPIAGLPSEVSGRWWTATTTGFPSKGRRSLPPAPL